jgi:hypothetical protein
MGGYDGHYYHYHPDEVSTTAEKKKPTKVAVVQDSHKLFLSLTGEFKWKFFRLPFIYWFFSLRPFIQILPSDSKKACENLALRPL